MNGEEEGLFVGQPQGKRPQGRPGRSRCINNKMCLRDIEWGDMDWDGLAEDKG
jgi:hypothetical protein